MYFISTPGDFPRSVGSRERERAGSNIIAMWNDLGQVPGRPKVR